MNVVTIVCLSIVLLGMSTPARAQRFGNSSLDFYDQGLVQLEREVQRLQAEPGNQEQPLPLLMLPDDHGAAPDRTSPQQLTPETPAQPETLTTPVTPQGTDDRPPTAQ